MAQQVDVRITKIITETSDCKSFQLETVDGSAVPYKPGQFLTFLFTTAFGEERRSYSISSSPILNEPLTITVKKIPNGAYSRKLVDTAKPGDVLTTIGASGFFTMPDNIEKIQQVFFLAAGSGITPVFGLIKTLLHTKPTLKLVLIYSNRSKEDTIFYEVLHALQQQYPSQLQIEWLMSSHYDLSRARLSKWLLPVLLREYGVTSYHQTLFYLCGPFDYMRMATIQLLTEGVPADHIRKENFVIFKPIIRAQPPDTNQHEVTIHFGNQSYLLQTQYPTTILQAAKKQGIDLPYSCEAGRCGTCAAICTKGTVWMSYNEVLLDEEIAKGRILTCVGFPVHGPVELKID